MAGQAFCAGVVTRWVCIENFHRWVCFFLSIVFGLCFVPATSQLTELGWRQAMSLSL